MISAGVHPPVLASIDPRSADAVWKRADVATIDQLSDAVIGAGLDAVQMSRGECCGSLAFHERGGVTISSGRLNGTVSLRGSLTEDRITVGVVLRAGPGSWHWMQAIQAGSVGVFRAGDMHDAFYGPESCYIAATLTLDELAEHAAQEDMVLDDKVLGGSRTHPRLMAGQAFASLRAVTAAVHDGTATPRQSKSDVDVLLAALAHSFARPPNHSVGPRKQDGYAVIVARARAHIHDNLHDPISVEDLVAVALTSRRTLFRAFIAVLGEPPHSHVRRLRLHRIRHDLASEQEGRCTIALVAGGRGIDEPGRLAGWYKELFGELPSQTIARRGSSSQSISRLSDADRTLSA